MQTKAADLGKTLGDLTKKEQAILWMQSDSAFVAEEDA
jgi:hypothetical protein